jgi:hypothetical protein
MKVPRLAEINLLVIQKRENVCKCLVILKKKICGVDVKFSVITETLKQDNKLHENGGRKLPQAVSFSTVIQLLYQLFRNVSNGRPVLSFNSVSNDKSIASSKPSSPVRVIWCFLFQIPVPSHGHPVAACVFFIVFPFLLSILQYSVLQGSFYAGCDQCH